MAANRPGTDRILVAPDIGVDAGSTATRIAVAGRGVALVEPSLVALDFRRGTRPAALGEAARRLEEQDVPDVTVLAPIQAGVVADFARAAQMLQAYIRRVLSQRTLLGPRAAATVPTSATGVERTALHEALRSAGCRHVLLADHALASAMGAGISVREDHCQMVVDIGGGATDVAVVIRGRVVVGRTLRYGGDDLDEALRRYVRHRYRARIDTHTARAVKLRLSSIDPSLVDEAVALEALEMVEAGDEDSLRGLTGLTDVLAGALEPIFREVLWFIEDMPPERRTELMSAGMVVTGGGAMLRGIGEYLAHRAGLPVRVASEPDQSAIIGLNAMLQDLEALSDDGKRFRRHARPGKAARKR